MVAKTCFDCLFSAKGQFSGTVCDYPVPAYIQIRCSSGNFITGNEAESCALYKTKLDLVQSVKDKTHE
jgi:hypothetical protein